MQVKYHRELNGILEVAILFFIIDFIGIKLHVF